MGPGGGGMVKILELILKTCKKFVTITQVIRSGERVADGNSMSVSSWGKNAL